MKQSQISIDYILNKNEEFRKNFLNAKAALASQDWFKTEAYKITQEEINNIKDEEQKASALSDFNVDIFNHFCNICLIHDEETRNALLKMGFNEEDLIWLMPFEKIEQVIKNINLKGNFLVSLRFTIATLYGYLRKKIAVMVLDRFAFSTPGARVPLNFDEIAREGVNTSDNIDNHGGPQTQFEHLMYLKQIEMNQLKEKLNGENDHLKNFMGDNLFRVPAKYKRGNIDSLLIPIYKYDIVLEESKYVIADKLFEFYPLFSLMMPHRNDFPFKITEFDHLDVEIRKSLIRDLIVKKMRKHIFKK